jgi:hypothetical protein
LITGGAVFVGADWPGGWWPGGGLLPTVPVKARSAAKEAAKMASLGEAIALHYRWLYNVL